MKRWVLMVTLGVAATAVAAEQGNMSFSAADSNSDGAITRDEAASFAALEQRFDKLDVNNNGLIERQEFGADQAATSAANSAE